MSILVSPDIAITAECAAELEQPVTDEQFKWLYLHGRLDNGKTYEENQREEIAAKD